jgi:hypothetical protein
MTSHAACAIRYLFFITSALLLLNAVWVYITVYRKLNRQEEVIPQKEDSYATIRAQ